MKDFDLNPSVQALGSPEGLFANAAAAITMVRPIVRWTATEVADREWTIEQHFGEGFEPFEELCAVHTGILQLSSFLFGYPLAVWWRSGVLAVVRPRVHIPDPVGSR